MKYFLISVCFLILGTWVAVLGTQGNPSEGSFWVPLTIAGSMVLMMVFLSLHFLHSLEFLDKDESKVDQSSATAPAEVINLDESKV